MCVAGSSMGKGCDRGRRGGRKRVRGDGSVADKGRVVGLPKFPSWGKCTMPLTNINSDWMSDASSGLCVILYYIMQVL